MSAPDKIWASAHIADRCGAWTDADHDVPWETPYLRLDGPTLTTVREALREWRASYDELNGIHTIAQEITECVNKLTAAEEKLSAALKLLEGE